MRPVEEVLHAEQPLSEALELAGQSSAVQTWPVLDREGLVGLVTRGQMNAAAEQNGIAKTVSELVQRGEFPHLHTDHSLDEALDRFGASHMELLPVVSRANVHEMVGVIRLRDVLEAYGVVGEKL